MYYQQHIEQKKVASLKWLYKLLENFFIAVWGLTVIDLIAISINQGIFNQIDNWIKTFMAGSGVVYFIWRMAITLPHKKRMLQLEFEQRKIEIELLKMGGIIPPKSNKSSLKSSQDKIKNQSPNKDISKP